MGAVPVNWYLVPDWIWVIVLDILGPPHIRPAP